MSVQVYQVKLLELHSVHKELNHSYLRVKLTSDQETELLWHIDEETAESLLSIIDPEGVYKYRLSFHSSWNSAKNQYESFLTKTYRDQSERVYFSCSEAYVSGLNAIKNNEPASEIQTQAAVSEASARQESRAAKEIRPPKLQRKLTWSAVALLSLVFTILLGSSMPTFIYRAASGEEVNASVGSVGESEINRNIAGYVAGHRAVTVSSQFKASSNNEPRKSLQEPVQLALPSVALEEEVTFGLPKGKAALTFDDGPSKYTKAIADILTEHEVGGTFFFIGKNVKKYPDSVQYAKSSGYAVGSHSMNHLELPKLSGDKQKYEITHPNELIEKITKEPVVLFRPPYGAHNDSVTDIVRGIDNKMVLWNVDTKDWESRDAEKIYNSVAKSKVSGSIILLHESQATVDALPRIIQFLKEQDLEIVNLQ
ncbi:hypothetical protein YSY43_31050 [Paenibacillus sp. YSY-4.3]